MDKLNKISARLLHLKAVVPNLFGTRDRFHGRQFFHGRGGWMVLG